MTTLLPQRLDKLAYWISEREAIRIRKESGLPKPWTADPVLQTTRFCCVRRLDDKVSKWLLNEWYSMLPSEIVTNGDYLGMAGLARLINWPDTLTRLVLTGLFGVGWNQAEAISVLRAYRNAGNKIFTGAYIINAAGANGSDKIEVVCRQANTLFRHGELLDTSSMESTHANLMNVPGIGSFMAGQIVADLRHVAPGAWEDRMRWAPLGPGSHRGLNWLYGWDGIIQLPRMTQDKFQVSLTELIAWFEATLPVIFKDRQIEAHDVQNCLCEYDKFMRLSNGTGRGKNKYPGI